MPSSSCRTTRAGRASSDSRIASACPAGSKCGAGRWKRLPCCMCSICWRSKATTCARCRSSSAKPCSSKSCPVWARSNICRTSRRTARRCTSRSWEWDSRGSSRSKRMYAGRAGSGFTDAELKDVTVTLERGTRETPACTGPVPPDAGHTWVEPTLIAEIRYKEWTDEGLLRQPVFVRFRDDKPVSEIAKKGAGSGERDLEEPPAITPGESGVAHPEIKLSNLDKVFWPDEGYTKGDLIEYYRAISPWMLPYLTERPLVLTRFPDGINGKSFFQKDAPEYAQAFVRTITIWSEDSQRELDYFVCDNESSLLYIANMAAILLHVWSSRVETLEAPDWCILDLDPKDAPFTDVVTVAKAVKALCDDIGLPTGIKTSGSTGLHVLIPLGRQCTYEQSRTLGGLLARVIAAELPDIATVTRQVQKRGGKVYLDYVQNGHGRLLVAPFSARPLPGAPVSMPLKWTEVTPKLDIKKFTIKTAPARMQKLGDDPLRAVLEHKPDLVHALEQLHDRLG